MPQNKFTKRQQEKLERIKNNKFMPNKTHCANCSKSIDIEKDSFIFGGDHEGALTEEYIYCCEKCASWHFSNLMY